MAKHSELAGVASYNPIGWRQSADPVTADSAYVTAGKIWVDTTTGPPYQLKVRNSGDTAWETVGTVTAAASETVAGIAEIATTSETNTGTDDARIVTPLKLASRTSTETRAGVIEIATQSETNTGTDDARAVTPAKLSNYTGLSATPDASETVKGKAEIATQAETDTGTDDTRIVTPLKLANYSGLGTGGSADLEGLSDVDLTSPAIRQGLFYDGSNFVNQYEPGHLVSPESVSSNTTGDAAEHTYIYDTSGGNKTFTLPTAVGRAGKRYSIKKATTDANTVTVGTTSSQTIDGAATVVLDQPNEGCTVYSDNANWHTEARPYAGTAAGGVPTGGTTGEVLTKDSASSYDYSWQPTSGAGVAGYTPYALPIGVPANTSFINSFSLVAGGGTAVIPIVVDAAMSLDAVLVAASDTTSTRGPIEFAIFVDNTNASNSLDVVSGAVGTLAAYTASGAAIRSVPPTSPPAALAPGLYFLAVKNNHASNALTLQVLNSSGTFNTSNNWQSKTLSTSAFGSTLDMVAATWTKQTSLPGVRLAGRVFGQSTAF